MSELCSVVPVTLDAFLTLVVLLLAGAARACAEVPGWSFGTKSGGEHVLVFRQKLNKKYHAFLFICLFRGCQASRYRAV